MFTVGFIGFGLTQLLNNYVHDRATATAIAAFAIGIMGNLYARITKKLALVAILPSIGVLLPGGMAMKGVTALMSSDLIGGTQFAFQVVEVAMAITVGLFVANMVVFPLKKRSRGSTINL